VVILSQPPCPEGWGLSRKSDEKKERLFLSFLNQKFIAKTVNENHYQNNLQKAQSK
jgi:hypothetical protein